MSSASATTSSASSSASKTTRAEGTISGSGGVIKAGAATRWPAKVGKWVKAGGSGNSVIFNAGDSSIGAGFLPGSDYTGISENVSHSRTKVGSGVCGSTSVASNLVCYLKTADGVITLSTDGNATPLVALVDFADQLTTTLGKS